ncbi:MAG: hypothetical protein GW771_05080 [Flavobacteriia bacterium]|nr:hypothetical protein [Flavobacteriia bacterium]
MLTLTRCGWYTMSVFCNLSYNLSKNVFNSDDIRRCYKEIHENHNLPSSQAKEVIIELESHTGIFLQTGYNSYEFSHKSLQEYLTARYLIALPTIPNISILNKLPNETAIITGLSSKPSYYFEYLNLNFKRFDEKSWNVFLPRLVEEKPDFDPSPKIVIFFFKRIWSENSPIFKTTFLKLLEITNLKVALKAFFTIYKIDKKFDEYLYFMQKKIDLEEFGNSFPTQVHLKIDLYKKIKNYI